jgi:hypothetical protein
MGYRIRAVPEVEAWLGELRGSDPGAADLVDEALDALREGGAGLGPPLVVPAEAPAHQTRPARREEAVRAAETSSPELSELRPGAPGAAGIRILFTVVPPDTALLLTAGTERDWLRAWYAETIPQCRDRYDRHQTS